MCYKFYKHYNFQTIITFKKGPLIFLNRRSFLYASMHVLYVLIYLCTTYCGNLFSTSHGSYTLSYGVRKLTKLLFIQTSAPIGRVSQGSLYVYAIGL